MYKVLQEQKGSSEWFRKQTYILCKMIILAWELTSTIIPVFQIEIKATQ